MRIALAIHNYFNDPNTGAMQSVRTVMKWLAQAGHECHVLCTARIDTSVELDPQQHLEQLGLETQRHAPPKRYVKKGKSVRRVPTGRPTLSYTIDGVEVTMLMTRHNQGTEPDRAEAKQFITLLEGMFDRVKPDLLFSYGSHTVVPLAMRAAHERGITTLVTVRNEGFEIPKYFEHANHVLTCSPFLTDLYRQRIGLTSTALAPPMDWSQIVAPKDSRAFVTFVNPRLEKGAAVFARVADMLGSRRPDIPIMVVQSGQSAGMLNSVPGIDFSQYPQIVAAPPTTCPAEYFALTKILMVPSAWAEPFGRVAAEAMINGIPALVSDRGALPDVVGGDFSESGGALVLPLPDKLEPKGASLISEDEAQPWFDAICRLWDDDDYYQGVATRASQIAQERYSEAVLQKQYLDYFTSLKPDGSVFTPQAAGESAPNQP